VAPRVHPLEHGTPIATFEAGGARAEWFARFMGEQKVEGVLVLVDGRSASSVTRK